MRRWRLAAAIFAALVLFGIVAGMWVAQSGWLRDKIRAGIIAQAEKASGGRVEIGAFKLDWHNLTATVDRFVVHGTEPAGHAALLTIERLVVRVRILSVLRRDISIASIDAERPVVSVIVATDGTTNLPRPKLESKEPLQDRILDLKISRFDLRQGAFSIEKPRLPAHSIPLDAHGENLSARVNYDAGAARYTGDVALDALHFLSLDLQLSASGALERNRIVVSRALVQTSRSRISLNNAVLNNFRAPVLTARFDGGLSLAEAGSVFGAKFPAAGDVVLSGNLRFAKMTDYSVSGTLQGSDLSAGSLRNVRLSAHFDIDPEKFAATGIQVNVLGGDLSGSVLTADFRTFRAAGRIAHFDLRQVAKLKTNQPLPYDGLVSGPFEVAGQWGELNVTTSLDVSPTGSGAPVHGDVVIHYDASTAKVNLGDSWLELPHTRADVSGTLGSQLKVKIVTTDFNDLAPAIAMIAGSNAPAIAFGSLRFDGYVNGALANPQISGHAVVTDATYESNRLRAFAGDIALSRANATFSHAEAVYSDIHARGSGSVQLSAWSATVASALTASVEIDSADITKILIASGHKEVAFTGTLNANARVTGTLGSPLADADVTLAKGTIYAQPFDSITGRLQVVSKTAQALTGLFVSGPKRVNITARFEHAGTRFPAGMLDFNLTSNTMPLNQIAVVRQRQPDIHGFGKFHADGALRIGHDARHDIEFNLMRLNADASANGLELGGRSLGDARFTAQTKDDVITARFDSNAAKAAIHGDATVHLDGDYAVNGKLTFADAGLNALAALAVPASDVSAVNFDGSAEGELTFNGPLRKPEQMSASLNMPRLEIRPLPGTVFAQSLPNFVATNDGPVRATLSNSSIRVEAAHLKAPETDVAMTGSIALTQQSPLNLRVQGTVNLALARSLNADLTSSGSLALNATVRGSWRTPDVAGRAAIRQGDFHYADFSNGLTEATGEVVFNGTHATIQSFTAQSGGGKVDVTGFAALTNGLLGFRIEARAHEVRVRYPEGVSSVSDADLTFAGTSQRSETSGTIAVHRVSINPKSDAASILASTAAPIQTPAAKNGFASNMNLDVQISTAPDVTLQTSVTQSLQADANLRLRGTATNPALIGRINITQGEMVFFGNKYSINAGSISFFNPARIDPILNIDLETKARGVDVILTVSGPVNKLNVSYRSDPPLQFSDIVALLATGRAPSDPTLAVRDTGQSQNFQQLGASALIGQAIANPVAGRLQRFFGVSRLKIDPSLTGITGSPEARLTIEQQVTPEILFTYITDVSSTSTQLIRVELSFNRHWSAILIREENGYVGLDFAYKKRFK